VTSERDDRVSRMIEGPVLSAYAGVEDARVAIRRARRQVPDGRAAVVPTVWDPQRKKFGCRNANVA
jgi:hypothetical protein